MQRFCLVCGDRIISVRPRKICGDTECYREYRRAYWKEYSPARRELVNEYHRRRYRAMTPEQRRARAKRSVERRKVSGLPRSPAPPLTAEQRKDRAWRARLRRVAKEEAAATGRPISQILREWRAPPNLVAWFETRGA